MKFRSILLTLILGILLMAQGVLHAQEVSADLPPFAAVEEGSLMIADANGELQAVYSAQSIFYLTWNADGSKLAFLQMDEEFTIGLGVYDTATGEASLLETPTMNTGFLISWMSDGRILFGGDSAENDPVNNPVFLADILAIEPVADAQPELLGSFEYGVGCGGGSSIPADWLYGEETSSLHGNFLTLEETPHGILASLNCGGTGVGLLDTTTGEFTVVSEIVSHVVVSPDGSQIAGVELNYEDPTAATLLVYALDSLAVTQIETAAGPDQLAWSADGTSLYYTSRTVVGNLIDDLSADELAVLTAGVGYEMTDLPAYTAELYRVSAAGGEFEDLVSVDAYAIARLTVTADGLYYTTISNVGEWLQGVVAGEVNPTDLEVAPPHIDAQVYFLSDGAEPALVGEYHQFTPFVAD